MHSLRTRLVAVAGLALMALLDFAPHRHNTESLELFFTDAANGAVIDVVDCQAPARAPAHFDPDRRIRVDSCIACLRQHMQALNSAGIFSAPLTVLIARQDVLRVEAQRALLLRKASRGPPLAVC